MLIVPGLKNSQQLTAKQVLQDGNEPQLREEYNNSTVNAQKWLDQNYPNKKVKEIYLNQQLVGELDCRDYDNLEKISISSSVDESKFRIKRGSYKDYWNHWGKTQATEIIQCIPAQTYLHQQYPTPEAREQVKKLEINDNNLEGELDLSKFMNLEELNLSNNYLTHLIYPPNSEQLTRLEINDNNLPTQDLSVFSQFKNLWKLEIGNHNKSKISHGIYNRFTGSLAPFQSLNKLWRLNIANTDLNSGVEYLPTSLKYIYYATTGRPACQLEEIREQLDLFTNKNRELQQKWKELGFTSKQVLGWINIGLKIDEYNLANYLKKGKNLTPSVAKNSLVELTKDYHQAPIWLDWNYPQKQRASARELIISNQNLWGDLDLQDFPNLEKLDCSDNELTGLNLNNNLKLNQFFCSKNRLIALDLSKNESLVNLDCSDNKFTNLDLSQSPEITQVECENNPELECLKGSKSLKKLVFREGKLKELDLSQCENLTELDCSDNQLIELDLSNCSKLQKLNCSNNQLTNLDLNNNIELTELLCSNKKPNHKKLIEITFAPDFEYSKLERINIIGNDNLDYVTIDKRFLKRLPEKMDYQIPALDSQTFEKIIWERTNIPGKVTKNLKELKTESKREKTSREEIKKSLKNINKEIEEINKEPLVIVEKRDNSQQVIKIKCSECYLDIKPKQNYWYNKNSNQDFCSKECYQKFKLKRIDLERRRYEEELEELKKTEQKINELEQKIKDKEKGKDITGIYSFATWWNPNCALVVNKVVWYAVRLVVYEPTEKDVSETLKVIKVSEHLYPERVKKKIAELKTHLDNDNPILALYSHNFSPSEVIQRTVLPPEAERKPDKYLRSTDLIWRTMNIPSAYHVAIYLGNNRVAHIGSSKFVKTGKINAKSNKALLGARNDHWLDFLKDTKELIRYRLIIPFKRPEVIQKHISQAILAEYGQKEYSFLGNNCEHFATLCVCGVPFSTQVDKISLLTHKVYLDLTQEVKESEAKFNQMTTQENFHYETNRLKEYFETKVEELASKEELTTEEQQKLISLVHEWDTLEELQSQQPQVDLSEVSYEIDPNSFSPAAKIISLVSSPSETSELNWEKIIQKKIHIPGTVEQIIPLESNPNQVLVVNKVIIYAVRLLEYNPHTQQLTELTELKRFAKNKVGYVTLEDALAKVERIKAGKQKENQVEETASQIEIPPKK